MSTYKATITGLSPLSQGKYHNTDKKPREAADAFEERTWHMRLHIDEKTGKAFIPSMAFKNGLMTAGKKLSMKVPGQARKTFTSIITSGIICPTPAVLNFGLDDCEKETLFVSANGKSGQGTGTRVMRHFPTYRGKWTTEIEFFIMDPAITKDVLLEHLQCMGKLVGVGRFRPEVGGFYGMFNVDSLVEIDKELSMAAA
jgi:hypothetical protein